MPAIIGAWLPPPVKARPPAAGVELAAGTGAAEWLGVLLGVPEAPVVGVADGVELGLVPVGVALGLAGVTAAVQLALAVACTVSVELPARMRVWLWLLGV